jgi:hypothetical protein
VNIGIEKETEDPTALSFKHLQRINGTWGTANVKQYFQNISLRALLQIDRP